MPVSPVKAALTSSSAFFIDAAAKTVRPGFCALIAVGQRPARTHSVSKAILMRLRMVMLRLRLLPGRPRGDRELFLRRGWIQVLGPARATRSEEHTSELQSLTNLVC